MKKHLRWIIPVAIVLVIVIAVGLSGRRGAGAPTANAEAPTTPNGRRAAAETGDLAVRLSEVGVIQPERAVEVKSKVSGRIQSLFVEEGQDVRKGALVATVEPDMAQARTVANLKSSYGRARVDLERARQDYEIDLAMHRGDHISDEELQISKDAYDIANIEFQSALEQMRLAEEDGVSLDLEAETGEVLDIAAPASGTVIDVQIEEGEIVTSGALSYTSGTTLMIVADLDVMQIRAGVNEVDVGKIREGQDVVVDVDAYPNAVFHGLISQIAPAAREEQGVKVFDVEIDITDSDERLKPGMTANIEIQGDHREGVVKIPVEAAFKKEGRYVVYVFDGSEDEPVEREVVTGVSTISEVEIVEGLAEGEEVALYDPEVENAELSEDEQRRRQMSQRAGRRG